MRFCKKHIISAIAASTALLVWATSAHSQELAQAEAEIQEVSQQVSRLENEFLKPAVLASRYKTEARFNDAKVAYYLEDYHRAAVLFVDIVQKENQSFGSYREALYLLGDSLARVRNYQGARNYFRQILELGSGLYFQEAASRYLEISFESRNFDGVEDVLNRVQRSGQMSAGLHYISGKALYRQDRYPEARAEFQRAASDPEYRLMAEYFRGVVLATEGKLDEARSVYAGITNDAAVTSERDQEIVNLAFVARGRLAYEKADYDTAIDMYSRIPRFSEHFDQALWEMTWTLIAKEMFREARRNVEILLFSDPDPEFVAQARLLKADLSVRLNQYELAEEDFQDVLTEFQPVKDEMDTFVADRGDLRSFFTGMVEQDLEGNSQAGLPPLVEKWLDSDATIRNASRLIRDVRDVNAEIDETRQVLAEVNARLDSTTRVQSFPELAEGMALGIEAENRLTKARRLILNAHYQEVSSRLSTAQEQRWESLSAELDRLEKAYAEIPKDREAIAERDRAVHAEYARLQRELDRVDDQLDGQRAILAGVDVYIQNEYGEPLTEDQKTQIDALKSEVRETLKELEEVRSALQLQLKIARDEVGVGDPVSVAERDLRERYAARMDEASSLLQSAGRLERAQSLRQRIQPLERRLQDYFTRMESLVNDKVSEIRDDVRNEEKMLAQHKDSLDELIYASQDGAGVLAYINFMRARADFNAMILRAEVGLVDVKWQKKEEMSNTINQLFENRTRQLRQLQQSFEEVR